MTVFRGGDLLMISKMTFMSKTGEVPLQKQQQFKAYMTEKHHNHMLQMKERNIQTHLRNQDSSLSSGAVRLIAHFDTQN